MAVTLANTGSDIAAQDPTQTYFHRRMLRRVMHKNYYGKWAEVVDIPMGEGRNIIMRRWLNLQPSIAALVEGVPPTGKTPTLDDFTVSLSQQGDFIVFTDMVSWAQQDPFLREWTDVLGEQEGYSIDILDRNTFTAGTNAVFANGAARTAINSVVDGNDFDRAIRTLESNGAEYWYEGSNGSTNINTYPHPPMYAAIVHPHVKHDLQNINGYKNANEVRGLPDGAIGCYKEICFYLAPDPVGLGAGARVVTGSGAASTAIRNTGGTADVYLTQIFGKKYCTRVRLSNKNTNFYNKPLGSAGAADPLNQIQTIGWKYVGARLITNQALGVRVESGAAL